MSEKTYKPGNYPDLPPPPGTVGVYGWIRQNLFSSVSNALLTIISVVLLYYLIDGIIGWFFLDAVFVPSYYSGNPESSDKMLRFCCY